MSMESKLEKRYKCPVCGDTKQYIPGKKCEFCSYQEIRPIPKPEPDTDQKQNSGQDPERTDEPDKKRRILPIIVLGIAAVFVVGIASWFIGNKGAGIMPEEDNKDGGSTVAKMWTEAGIQEATVAEETRMETETEIASETEIETESESETKTETEPETEAESETETEIQNNDYILPESASKYLTKKDIKGMTLQEINYAKNEIYARRGRRFKSTELQEYFDSKEWYNGTIDPDDFDKNYVDKLFNAYEKENAEFLLQVEHSMDPKGYQLDQ